MQNQENLLPFKRTLPENDLELQALIDGIDHGIAIIDSSFSVHYVNKLISSLFSSNTSTSKKCYQALYQFKEPCDFCPFKRTDKNLMSPTNGNFHQEQEIILSIEQEFLEKKIFYHNVHTIIDYQKRLFIVEVLKDITQEKRDIEKELRTQKLATLGSVIQTVAHELQNPLTGISFTIQKMLTQEEDEEKKKNLLILEKDLQLASSIVSELHQIHQHETYYLEPVSLNETLKTTYEQIIRSRSIIHKIIYNWECDESILIMANATKLQQVFTNLFTNAFDAFQSLPVREQARATIWIVIREDEKSLLKIQIIDNGGGIAEHKLQRIFDPYYSTKKTKLNIGLGLHVVHQIIEEHTGKIEADSNGIFTRFSIFLPFEKDSKLDKRYSGKLYDYHSF